MSYKSVVLYYNWLQDKIARNVPFDQTVRELLSSTGGTFTNPATNYYQVERDNAQDCREYGAGFMACASNARSATIIRSTAGRRMIITASPRFFAQVARKPGEDPREVIVFNTAAARSIIRSKAR